MDYRGLVVADDLTGAADTGHRLAARGHEVAVADSDGPDADVLVRDTDSRYLAPEEAAGRVRDALGGTDAGVVYKKVDSTLRGNLVAEVDAAIELGRADLAVVAPAFPAQGRITVGGQHLLDGTPVAETEQGNDPDAPVETSSLPEVFSTSDHPVAHLPIDLVSDGPGAIRTALAKREEPTIVACDAARDDHLEAIVLGASRLDAEVLYVGSTGLAGHVRLGDENDVLGIAGSVARETLAGLDALPETQVVVLDGPRVVTEREAVVEAAAGEAIRVIDEEGRAVVTAARSRESVAETVRAGADAAMTESETRDLVSAALGSVARLVADRRGFDGLYLTGGATASAVLDELDAGGLRLTGRSVESGVPIGRIEGGIGEAVPVVTRAGGYGDAETTLSCLDALATYDG